MGFGGRVTKGKNVVELKPGFKMEVFLHETGHIIDYHLGGDTGGFWSEQGFQPLGWQPVRFLGFLWQIGWVYDEKVKGEPPAHSWANPVEDFADTFALWVMVSNGMAPPDTS